MTNIVINNDNQRLDEICVQYYGDLTLFDAVLAANPQITTVHLPAGTVLMMPDVAVQTEQESLW